MTEDHSLPPVVGARYRLGPQLGAGGMARVFCADDLQHGRQVAIKVLRAELATAVGAERFVREIQVAARLSHAHIVPLFDSGVVNDVPWYVMPLVRGETLRRRLELTGSIPVREAVELAAEVAEALAHAHEMGIAHRDIKPENILIEDGRARVTDFGIASALSTAGGGRLTATGLAVGTLRYMSPEQAAGEPSIDARSDLYSLGCVLHEMLTGELPSRAQTNPVLRRIDRSLAGLVKSATSLAPEDRPASADAFARALRKWLATTAGVSKRQRVARTLGVVAMSVAGIAVTVAIASRSLRPAPESVSRDLLAVFPFSIVGAGDPSDLRRGIVYLLDQALNGSGALRSVNPQSVFSALPSPASDPDPPRAYAIASHFGAGRFVLGAIVEMRGRVRLSADVYSGPATRDTGVVVEGPKDSIPGLVNTLAVRLLSTELARRGSLRTIGSVSNPEALRLYLDGLAASSAGSWNVSVERFRAAVALDSMLIPAWFQLADDAFSGVVDDSIARVALARTLRFRDRLTTRDNDLIAYLLARDSGAVYSAARLAQAFVRRYPRDHEGFARLGGDLVNTNALLGRSVLDAERAYRQASTLYHVQGVWDIDRLGVAIMRRDRAGVDSLWRRMSSSPTQHDFEWSVYAARPFLLRDRAGIERVVAEAKDRDQGYVFPAAINVAMVDPRGAVRIEQILADPSRPSYERANALVNIAYLYTGTGKLAAADSALTAADSLDHTTALLNRAWLLLLPNRLVSPDTLTALRRVVEGASVSVSPTSAGEGWFTRYASSLRAASRFYILGLIAARLADSASARRNIDQLERLTMPFEAGTLTADLARGIQIELRRVAADTAGALALFDWTKLRVRFPSQYESPFLSRARERYVYATMLDAKHELDAQRWLEATAVNQYLHDVAFKPDISLRFAQLLERIGRSREANDHYQNVVSLLSESDPSFAGLFAQAAAGVRRTPTR